MAQYQIQILDALKNRVAVLSKVLSASVTEQLNGPKTIQVVSADLDELEHIAPWNSFVRYVDEEDPSDYRTFRISAAPEVREGDDARMVLQGQHILFDMALETFAVDREYTHVDVDTLVGEILGHSAFSKGTVDNGTDIVEYIQFVYPSVLEALEQVRSMLHRDLTFTESTETVNVLDGAGSDNGVRIQYRRNLVGMTRGISGAGPINRVYVVGGGEPAATIEHARFEVQSVSTNTITLTTGKCIPEDDSYVGRYIYVVDGTAAGNSYGITSTAAGSNDTITSGTDLAAAGVGAGDLIELHADGSGTPLDHLEAGASQATYGVREAKFEVSDIEEVENRVATPSLDGAYVSGSCENWDDEASPVRTENTDDTYYEYGTASQRVQTNSEDEGISQTLANIDSGEAHSCLVHLYISSGRIHVRLTDDKGTVFEHKTASGTTGFVTIEVENFLPIASAGDTTDVKLEIEQEGAANADFYVDFAQITQSPQNRQALDGRSADILYERGYDHLSEAKDPEYVYSVSFHDLYAEDPTENPYDRIGLGDTISVIDEELGIDAAPRVKQITRNLLDPTEVSIEAGAVSEGMGKVAEIVQDQHRDRNRSRKQRGDFNDVNEMTEGIVWFASRSVQFDGEWHANAHDGFGWSGPDTGSTVDDSALRIDDAVYTISAGSFSGLGTDEAYFVYFDKEDPTTFSTTLNEDEAHGENLVLIAMVYTTSDTESRCAIFPKAGQPIITAELVIAGVLQSLNWGSSAGSQFNLNDGTFKLGGSSSPDLEWADDGGWALTARGTFQTETTGQRVVVSGPNNDLNVYDSNGDLRVDIGDISGSYWSDFGAVLYDGTLAVILDADKSGRGSTYSLIELSSDTPQADVCDVDVFALRNTVDITRPNGDGSHYVGLLVDSDIEALTGTTTGTNAGVDVSIYSDSSGNSYGVRVKQVDAGIGDSFGVYIDDQIEVTGTGTGYAIYSLAQNASLLSDLLTIDQGNDRVGLHIDSEATSSYALDIDAKYGAYIQQDISGGKGLHVERNLSGQSNPLVTLKIDHTGDGQTVLKVRQDGAGDILQLFDGGTKAAYFDATGNLSFSASQQVDGVQVSAHQHTGVAGHGSQLDFDTAFSDTPTGISGGSAHGDTAHSQTYASIADAETVTGLWSFSRSTNPPFAVNSGAANVANLDADKLDGEHASAFFGVDGEESASSSRTTTNAFRFYGNSLTSGALIYGQIGTGGTGDLLHFENTLSTDLFSVTKAGNLTILGTVDGVDVAAHDHSGGSGATNSLDPVELALPTASPGTPVKGSVYFQDGPTSGTLYVYSTLANGGSGGWYSETVT